MFKKSNKKKANEGEITPEQWAKLNRDYYGKDNADWLSDQEEDVTNPDETEELNFGE